ncbi:lipopolysaccharide A protein [Eikenella longinqua]|uniref:Lipopolysaccharide A protein n=1 Tax=Eikenella longinqua TaxID=1795827 RepID=A0A1A9RYH4_9NEIS|nr:glycosyl transferase family 90 [Eikenella longinqua]OAM29307.1 lipopolysaccharide A protein [Eikenella longinqua]
MSIDLGIYHRRLHKLAYYTRHSPLGLLPHRLLAKAIGPALAEFAHLPAETQQHIHERVDYYNKQNQPFTISGSLTPIGQAGAFKRGDHISSYYYDLAALLRYFPASARFAYEFGDVTHIPAQPAFVKSRPIRKDNQHSVLLKFDSVRHFYIYPDRTPFAAKQDRLVWRGAAHQEQRLRFLRQYHSHPLCDVGCVLKQSAHEPYHRSFLSVGQQLQYKYILSIEGNDVATNLKWILASRSLCFMTSPVYETWLMEGHLQPEIHYVHLQPDYSDFDEKLNFYRQHPQAAERIIRNANAYMQPFFQPKQELITSLLVMQKYFSQLQD